MADTIDLTQEDTQDLPPVKKMKEEEVEESEEEEEEEDTSLELYCGTSSNKTSLVILELYPEIDPEVLREVVHSVYYNAYFSLQPEFIKELQVLRGMVKDSLTLQPLFLVLKILNAYYTLNLTSFNFSKEFCDLYDEKTGQPFEQVLSDFLKNKPKDQLLCSVLLNCLGLSEYILGNIDRLKQEGEYSPVLHDLAKDIYSYERHLFKMESINKFYT